MIHGCLKIHGFSKGHETIVAIFWQWRFQWECPTMQDPLRWSFQPNANNYQPISTRIKPYQPLSIRALERTMLVLPSAGRVTNSACCGSLTSQRPRRWAHVRPYVGNIKTQQKLYKNNITSSHHRKRWQHILWTKHLHSILRLGTLNVQPRCSKAHHLLPQLPTPNPKWFQMVPSWGTNLNGIPQGFGQVMCIWQMQPVRKPHWDRNLWWM